jgi:hypothetical protein
MDDFILCNKKAIFSKLDNIIVETQLYDPIQKKERLIYRCNTVIDQISTKPVRDKRLISDYNDDEVICIRSNVDTDKKRKYRYFTIKGLERYIHEGKIYGYNNVCEYYGFTPIDKEMLYIVELFKEGLCEQKKLLKWVFGKRKQNIRLPDKITLNEFADWLDQYKKDDINVLKKNKILKYAGREVNIQEQISIDMEDSHEIDVED